MTRSFRLAVGGLLLSAVPASACSVPVFRYALERWPPGRYEIVVFLSDTPAPADRALVDRLSALASAPTGRANLAVTTVDPTRQLDGDARALWEAQHSPVLPWMVVRYPRSDRERRPAWAGPLTDATVTALADSPARRQLTQRLADGQTAVWVLIESGDAAQDNAAADLLGAQLKRLQNELELPAPAGDAPAPPPDDLNLPALKLSFSLLRVSRTDPAERLFLAMLLHSEADLDALAEPMAFAVFGRGRALFALVGAGINAANIEDDCKFLVGPCSCQVKELNPGTDLILAVNWDDVIRGEWVRDAPLPSLPGLPAADADEKRAGRTPASAPAARASGPAAPPSYPATEFRAANRNVLLVALLGLVGLAVATLILKSKRAESSGRRLGT